MSPENDWDIALRRSLREALAIAKAKNATAKSRNLSIVITELETVIDRAERAINEVEGSATA